MASLQSRLSDLITAIGTDIKAINARTPGMSELIYRYTVVGSDKASIDTGVDTKDAGSGDWTNGDLLEIYIYARTDEAVVASTVNATLNNDTGAHYDGGFIQDLNTTVSGGVALGASAMACSVAGASCTASVFTPVEFKVPNYMGTVANKTLIQLNNIPDQTAANVRTVVRSFQFRSTSAISRFAITPATAAKKFKVGTQLLIYKRRAS